MIALYVVLSLLLLFSVILLLRVGFQIEYGENGISADARIGPIRFRVLPVKRKEKTGRKMKPREAPAAEKEPEEKKGGKFSEFRKYFSYVSAMKDRLKRKLRVDDLTLYFAAGGSDPVAVAMTYGGVTAAMSALLPVLEQNFDIRKRDFETSFSYELKEPYIYFRAKISAATWELIYIALPMLSLYMKSKDTRSRKGEK